MIMLDWKATIASPERYHQQSVHDAETPSSVTSALGPSNSSGAEITLRGGAVLADSTGPRPLGVPIWASLSISDIAELLETEIANDSHNLRILHRHDLVTTQRQGKHIYYSLSPDFLQQSRGKRHLNLGCCRLDMPEEMI